jgi:hypothetical protein
MLCPQQPGVVSAGSSFQKVENYNFCLSTTKKYNLRMHSSMLLSSSYLKRTFRELAAKYRWNIAAKYPMNIPYCTIPGPVGRCKIEIRMEAGWIDGRGQCPWGVAAFPLQHTESRGGYWSVVSKGSARTIALCLREGSRGYQCKQSVGRRTSRPCPLRGQ